MLWARTRERAEFLKETTINVVSHALHDARRIIRCDTP